MIRREKDAAERRLSGLGFFNSYNSVPPCNCLPSKSENDKSVGENPLFKKPSPKLRPIWPYPWHDVHCIGSKRASGHSTHIRRHRRRLFMIVQGLFVRRCRIPCRPITTIPVNPSALRFLLENGLSANHTRLFDRDIAGMHDLQHGRSTARCLSGFPMQRQDLAEHRETEQRSGRPDTSLPRCLLECGSFRSPEHL